MSKSKLKDYEKKRDFARTPEPGAGGDEQAGDLPRFVVQ